MSENTKYKVEILKSTINIKKEEINIKQKELLELQKELSNIEWIETSWEELKEYLIQNKPDNRYESNPKVFNGSEYSYCKITETGELQIGPYYDNDNFPRNKPLYVAYDFRPYRE